MAAALMVGVRARSFTASLTERIDDIHGNGRAAACGSVSIPWLAQHDGGQYLKGSTKNIWDVSEPAILANPSIVRVSREARFVSSVSRESGPIPIRWDPPAKLLHET
jgi:hypothetical protein